MALGRCALVSALGQVSARYGDRGSCGAESSTTKALPDAAAANCQGNYLRFRLSPNAEIGLAARVKLAGEEFIGEQRELYLLEEQPGAESPYERLLGDAMKGDGGLFTREDAVKAGWMVVDQVLKRHPPVRPYKCGTWGPKQADALIEADGGWHNPGGTAS